MNMPGSVLKTNSLTSLCLSVWMCLFFIPLSPHSLQNPVIFVFLLFFFHHSSCCFLPLALSWLWCLHFFSLQLFPPSTVSFSLFIIPSCFSPLCHFHLLPPPSPVLQQWNKADIVLRDESCSKVKYHYSSDCHLDVLEIFNVFLFSFFSPFFSVVGWKKKKAFGSTNTQWIVLILHNFRFIHLRQAG